MLDLDIKYPQICLQIKSCIEKYMLLFKRIMLYTILENMEPYVHHIGTELRKKNVIFLKPSKKQD